MIFGISITGPVMIAGGLVMLLLVLFQVLLGLRVIKLGKRHRVVHRWVAFTILGFAVVHALLGVTFVTGLSIG